MNASRSLATIALCGLVSMTTGFGVAQTGSDERLIPLEGQPNFRDIGGYATATNKTVKRGVVFRSGRMPSLTDADLETLGKLGIQQVINFLTPEEIKAGGKNRLPVGASETLLPIDSDDGLAKLILKARQTGDFSELPADINPNIHRMLIREGTEQYAKLLRQVVQADAPLVFHCSHGIHRTGHGHSHSVVDTWRTVGDDSRRLSSVEHLPCRGD